MMQFVSYIPDDLELDIPDQPGGLTLLALDERLACRAASLSLL